MAITKTTTEEFIRDVFVGKSAARYEELLRAMREAEDEAHVIAMLQQIRRYSGQLAGQHEQYKELLEMLFSFDWGVPDAVVEEFEEILIALNLANAAFLEETFGLICRNFTAGGGEDASCEHLHDLVRRVLRVTPLGCSALLSVLIQHFPQKQNSAPIGQQCRYFREALRVAEYVPVLRDRLVGVAVERVLDLDIELAFEQDDEDGHDGEEEDANPPNKRLRVELDEMEVKLDSLLGVLFDYFAASSKKPLAFKSILLQFDRLLLRTRRSRCTQFWVFFASAQHKAFADQYLALLMGKMTATGQGTEDASTRRYAAGYLASFLARANFLHSDQLTRTVKDAVEWLVRKPDEVWEAAFQAVIYALIYKSSTFFPPAASDGGDKDKGAVLPAEWDAFYAQHCRLLPRDLAHEYALAVGRTSNSGGGGGRQMTMIDFPFDPLVLLEQTWKRVEPSFQFWQHADDEDEDGDEEEEDFASSDMEEEDEAEAEADDDDVSSASSVSSVSSVSSDEEEDEEEDDEEEFGDEALLTCVLPKAIQIQRIERMLGSMMSQQSPHARAYMAAVPPPALPHHHSSSSLPGRKRSLSTGSW